MQDKRGIDRKTWVVNLDKLSSNYQMKAFTENWRLLSRNQELSVIKILQKSEITNELV
jgi:hypothetical protein